MSLSHNPDLFKVMDTIQHSKGMIYTVVLTPDMGCRLEASNEPAYAYSDNKGTIWVRVATEMEDGRFKALPRNHDEHEYV